MTIDRFKRRMNLYTNHSSAGEVFREHARQVSDHAFANDPNYRRGMLYDWDLKPLEEIDFKIEKPKNLSAEGQEVEYYVQFLSDFHPEFIYKNRYFKKDGRERYGFYLDIENKDKHIMEKWLIINKDVRNNFSKYNAFKCNWCAEWVDGDNRHHAVLSCLREATDATFTNSSNNKLGGSTVDGEISLILPACKEVMGVKHNQRFIISDNTENPQAYEVTKIKDTSPLGVVRIYMKQCEFNRHTDFCGVVNHARQIQFRFKTPIRDLPDGFGRQYHAIADCILDQEIPRVKIRKDVRYTLHCSSDVIYVGSNPVMIQLANPKKEEQEESAAVLSTEVLIPDVLDPDFLLETEPPEIDPGFGYTPPLNVQWHYEANGEPATIQEVAQYFDLLEENHGLTIATHRKDLVGNVLTVYLSDEDGNESNRIHLEVKF